jgi:hypothetical protein
MKPRIDNYMPASQHRPPAAPSANLDPYKPKPRDPSEESKARIAQYAPRRSSHAQSSSEEEDIEDDIDPRSGFNFVTPEGLPLPGLNVEDSACSKLETLRLYLE